MKHSFLAISLSGLLVISSLPISAAEQSPEVLHILKIEQMASDMMVKGMSSMKDQILEAKKSGDTSMRVLESCDASAKTLAAFGRGDIDFQAAKSMLVKSLHKDGANGIQFAMEEGKRFDPSHMSTIIVKFEKSPKVSYDRMVELIEVGLEYAERNKVAKML